MADMARSILGEDGGKFAVLSASPDAANQNAWIAALQEALTQEQYANLELLEVVYGNDQSEESYNQALALVDKYPDMELIMAPTTVGIAAAAKAMQDEGLCETVKVSGLGLPAEMVEFTLNGCAPEFAPVELRRPGLPELSPGLQAGHGRAAGRRGRDLRGRAHGQLHDRERIPPATLVCAS
jgi:rhamnose transport system substrate-binding protein